MNDSPRRGHNKARSHKLDGETAVDYALGFGVWGLAVGDVDAGNPGDEVVAAAYRRAAVFDAQTLRLLGTAKEAPFGTSQDPWNFSWLAHVEIADINASSPGNEIVMCSSRGVVLVFNGQLQRLARFDEAGIVDLLVGPAPGMRLPATSYTKPIYLLSPRGHLASIEIDSTDPVPSPALSALSELQYGERWDLEMLDDERFGASPVVVGLFTNLIEPGAAFSPGTQTSSFRIFDASTLALDVGKSFGDLVQPNPGGSSIHAKTLVRGLFPSFAIARDAGEVYFVALYDSHLVVYDGNRSWRGTKQLHSFAPAFHACAVAAGEVDPATPGDEVVISTTAGKVVWFKMSELLDTSSTTLSVVRNVQSIGGTTYDHRTNTSLAATWALAVKPAQGGNPAELHAIDQTGTWWKVDPATGEPTFVRELTVNGIPFIVAGLAYAGAGMAGLEHGDSGGMSETFWRVQNPGFTFEVEIKTRPYLPEHTFWNAQGPGKTNEWELSEEGATGYLQDDFWVFVTSGGVAVEPASGDRVAAWWVPAHYPNHVQAARYKLAPAKMLSLWNSTGPPVPDPTSLTKFGHPPAPNRPDEGMTLRTEFNTDVFSQQVCRVGRVYPSAQMPPQAVVAGVGGKVLLLNSTPGTTTTDAILTQSEDFGFGGQALALFDLTGDGFDEVLFAPHWFSLDGEGNPARSRLYVLHHDGTSFQTLASADLQDLTTPDFPGYGACGIAVADLDPTLAGSEILVSTMNGELVVFSWSPSSSTLTPIHRQLVEGAAGAFNSIAIADLIGADGKPEVYIAGSSGLRRFDL